MIGVDEQLKQMYRQRIRQLRLLDDVFMSKCFEDIPCVQLVLRILLDKNDLEVQRVETQYPLQNIQGRSVRLDVYAVDSTGREYNIEIQRDDRGAGARRARLNSSLLDANVLDAGESADSLPETYVIFITEHDVLKGKRPLYHIERQITETGESFSDGSHILYANAEIRDDTPVGRLMADFACADPDQMHYETLAQRTRYFKETEKGAEKMSSVVDKWREEWQAEARLEGRKEGRIEGRLEERNAFIQRMLNKGTLPLEEIAELSGLPLADVKALAEKKKMKQ